MVKTEAEFYDNDKRLITLKRRAISMIQSALSQMEYFCICNLSTAREIWQALEIAHVNTLMTEYDLLRMTSGESIAEFELKFTHLINQLSSLGKVYDQNSQVRKILNILTKDWEEKVMAIEEARGESMRSFTTLFGSLFEYEGKIKFKKGLDEINNKAKGVAFNAIRNKEMKEEDEPEEDDDLGMIVRRFKKFYRKDQGF